MRRRSTTGRVVLTLGAATLSASLLFAHEGDGKLLSRHSPYMGDGFRAARGGTSPNHPSSGTELLSWLPCHEFGTQNVSANDLWGYVSPSGREYALIGLSHGTGFVDVTNPAEARIVGFIAGPPSLWRDVQVYRNYAYTGSEGGGGIQVIDLANIDLGQVAQVNAVTTPGTQRSHTVIINETSGYLYQCGGADNGLRIFSLADPVNPAFEGYWPDRYVHEAHVVTYTSGPFAGREIAFCNSGFGGGFIETGVDILDVTDKQNIVPLSRVLYESSAFSHQCWLSEDRKYLYLNDELDENGAINTTTIIFDVSNLNFPREVGRFSNGSEAIGHNLYVHNNLIYEANYRSGVRVFEMLDPLKPTEVAWYDPYPQDDAPEFNSIWGNYPYLPSGILLGSDIEQGLFVWRVSGVPLSFAALQAQPTSVDPLGQAVSIRVLAANGGQLAASGAKLKYRLGESGEWRETAMTSPGGGAYSANLPASPCGGIVQFYFEATSTSGVTVAAPRGGPAAAYSARYATIDVDVDLITDACDNCPSLANADQGDVDSDGVGNLCDNSVFVYNPDQADGDGDGVGDVEDGCPADPNKSSPGACGCGVVDGDGDGDGVPDCVDNCPGAKNVDQTDTDGDGKGDACDTAPPASTSDPITETPADEAPDAADGSNGSGSDAAADLPAGGTDDLVAAQCGAGACGAGVMPMIPLLVVGMLAMKRSGRARRA